MCLFLSNSGNLKSCIMMTTCILRQPARVLTSLVSPSNCVITPFCKTDLLIMEIFKPESKSTQMSLCSHGTNCISGTNGYGQFLFWNLNLWPMIIKSRCVSLNLIAIVFKGYGCIHSRGIRVVRERYFRCGMSWLFHLTHGLFIIIKSYFMMTITKDSCVSTRIFKLT
jgi:hypothetical protein